MNHVEKIATGTEYFTELVILVMYSRKRLASVTPVHVEVLTRIVHFETWSCQT
jgi:hypothetical protein